jgi:hypothetical protein
MTKAKKKPPKKLLRQTDKLMRWNLCQRLAKVAYDSNLAEYQLVENVEVILENFSPIKTK